MRRSLELEQILALRIVLIEDVDQHMRNKNDVLYFHYWMADVALELSVKCESECVCVLLLVVFVAFFFIDFFNIACVFY